MKIEQVLEKFSVFAEITGAVGRLRESLLQLAIQGKLVEQDTNDGSTVILLEEIRKCKKMRIHEGKAKRLETEPISNDQALFLAPASWIWLRLGDVADWGSGSTPARGNHALFGGGITWLKSGELNDCQSLMDSEETITDFAVESGSFRRNRPGDVLIAMYGATIGKTAILAKAAVTNQAVCGGTPFDGVDNRYLFWFLVSQRSQFHAISEGGAQPNISKVKLVEYPFPLPPLAEQKRIVAKVDELMALCDRLEAQQRERDARHAVLARASLTRFADAPTPANLNLLFHNSYAISPDEIRKAILTLAIQGRLSVRGLGNEPININKNSLRNSKTPKWAGTIEEKEKPFKLPTSWMWLRLGDVASLKHGYAFSSDFFTSNPTPFVLTTPGNFYEKGGFRDRESKRKYYSGPIDPEYILKVGDLIIPMTEQAAGLLGSPAFIPDNGLTYIHNQRLGKISLAESVIPEFAFWFFNSDFFRGELARTCTGMKVRHTSPDRILKVPFPVCPLAEQRRIVAKVDQLMALVDQLEAQLATANNTAAQLLDALVAELTGTTAKRRPSAASRASSSVPSDSAVGDQPDDEEATPGNVEPLVGLSGPSRAAALHSQESPDEATTTRLATLLRERGSLSNSEAQAATGLDAATLRAQFKSLVDCGVARTEGQRRGMRYLSASS